jgi:hypothetical protein
VSNVGRVNALRHRLNEVETRAQANATTDANRRSQPSKSTDKKKVDDAPLSPQLKEFVEKYPQLASSVRELVSKERKELEAELDERLGPVQKEIEYRKLSEAKSRLEDGASMIFDTPNSGVHYSEVLKSPLYREEFLPNQPVEFQRIANSTNDPDTALWVLRQFAEFAEDYARENGLMDDASDTEEQRTPKSKADEVSARRKRLKAEAGTPPSRSAVSDPEDSSDYETIFRQMNTPKRK